MKKLTLVGVSLLFGMEITFWTESLRKFFNVEEKEYKFRLYYFVLNEWLALQQEGKFLGEYLIQHNIRTVAIYGMGELGERLYNELKNSDVEVKYAINERLGDGHPELDMRVAEDELPTVDAVIVTAVFAFDEIKAKLSHATNNRIISLAELVSQVHHTREYSLLRRERRLLGLYRRCRRFTDNFCDRKLWLISLLYKADLLNVNFLDKICYGDLIAMSKRMILSRSELEKLMIKIAELQELAIKEKSKKRKIKVGFMAESSSFFGLGEVYQALLDDSHFEPYIIVPLQVHTEEEQNKQFRIMRQDAVQYFREHKMKCYAVKEKEDAEWGDKLPDILLAQVPYNRLYLEKNFWLENVPCSCMTMYVPYSFWIQKELDAEYIATGFAFKFSKIFAPSKVHKSFFEKRVGVSGKRLSYAGYPKLDTYYKASEDIDVAQIWKGGKNKVHIIYAPGFMDPTFSTFDLNYQKILEIARKTKETVSWVIRLHPNMAASCIRQGVFADEEEWEAYISQWRNLENAKVSINGSYSEIFKTSDAMIMDSISFLPGYQYVHKPLLFLTRERQRMNFLGNRLRDVVYTVGAEDMDGIEEFIHTVVMEGKDEKKNDRETFFKENLDYYSENGQLV